MKHTALAYATENSFLGPVTAVYQGETLCFLGFGLKAHEEALELWPTAVKTSKVDLIADLHAHFAQETTPELLLAGTPFQRAVWDALRTIPYGSTTTYKAIASKLGRPTAVRAVANAIGQNPISLFIPCHRVIGSTGKLHGYRWGLEVKKALLTREAEKQEKPC